MASTGLHSLEVRLLELPQRASLATAHDRGPAPVRELVVVCAQTDDGIGWGECSALNQPTYSAEWARQCYQVLAAGTEGIDTSPMAAAAVEMAVLDASLKAAGVPLARHLGVTATQVTAGVVVGLGPLDEVLATIDGFVAEGYRRVKLKVVPGESVPVVAAVRSAFPDVELQVDANGSFGHEQLSELVEMAHLGVTAVEQPCAPGDHDALRAMHRATDVPTIADESVATLGDAVVLQHDGLLRAVSVKAPRLGGLAAARELHDRCVGWGVGATAGGMLESGLGRHALVALAALPGFTITGDVSPARRWLAVDPWPDVVMVDGAILVPTGPGVAPTPDLGLLDRCTVQRTLRSAR